MKKVHLFVYLCCVWASKILAGKTEIWTTAIYCPKLYLRAVVLLFWQRTHPPAPILWLSGSNTFFSASFLSSRSSGSASTSSRICLIPESEPTPHNNTSPRLSPQSRQSLRAARWVRYSPRSALEAPADGGNGNTRILYSR